MYFDCCHYHRHRRSRCVTFQWVIYSKRDRKFSGIVFHVAFLVHKVEFNYCETVCDEAPFWCLSGWLHSNHSSSSTPAIGPPNNSWESNFIQLGMGACLLARFRFLSRFTWTWPNQQTNQTDTTWTSFLNIKTFH